MPRQICQQLRPGAQPVHCTEALLTAALRQRVCVRGGWTHARCQEAVAPQPESGDGKQGGLEESRKGMWRQLQDTIPLWPVRKQKQQQTGQPYCASRDEVLVFFFTEMLTTSKRKWQLIKRSKHYLRCKQTDKWMKSQDGNDLNLTKCIIKHKYSTQKTGFLYIPYGHRPLLL